MMMMVTQVVDLRLFVYHGRCEGCEDMRGYGRKYEEMREGGREGGRVDSLSDCG